MRPLPPCGAPGDLEDPFTYYSKFHLSNASWEPFYVITGDSVQKTPIKGCKNPPYYIYSHSKLLKHSFEFCISLFLYLRLIANVYLKNYRIL